MNQKASMIALFSLLILAIGIFLGLRIADQMSKETETPTDDVVVGLTRFILSRVEITELNVLNSSRLQRHNFSYFFLGELTIFFLNRVTI